MLLITYAGKNETIFSPSRRYRAFVSLLLLALFSLPLSGDAQTCTNPISNNDFAVQTAVCSGTVAYLLGTTPAGGSGTYTYKWQENLNNCTGNGAFTDIPGATQKDYAVPASATVGTCYRRIVVSGNCTSTSDPHSVGAAERTTPAPPTAVATPSSCGLNIGTITVTSPIGASYSINGVDYSNTTGVFTGLAPATYTLTAKVGTGCISPSQTVTVGSATTISGTATPATSNICSGGVQTLTATGGGTYQWYRNGQALSNATSNTYVASQAGTYYAVITNGGCTGRTNDAVVNVVSAPSGSISPTTAVACAGNTVPLTTSGGTSYQWYLNNVAISGATSATYNAGQAGTYTVQISNGGCTAMATNSATVTLESPTGSISPATAAVCLGSSQVLTATGGVSYQWYKDNVGIAGATSATYSASQAGVYSVDIITASGCKAKASNTVTITILPLPSGSITPATATICTGSTTTLTATGGTSYQWYLNGVALTGASGSTLSASQSGSYAAEIFDANGCKGRATNEGVVTVTSVPTGTISPGTATLCAGGSLTLSTSGGTSYQWYRNNVALPSQTGATLTVTQAGSYTVDIYSGSCKGSASNTATITTGNAPTGTITTTATALCPGNTVTLTATGGTSYQWYLNNAAIQGATTATYNATQTGTYSVVVFSGTGCSGPASNTITIAPSTAITFTTTAANPSCTSTTGSITVNAPSGGSGSGYTYSKDNGANFQASNVFNGLAPGNYSIVVRDAAGCKSTPASVAINAFASTLQGVATVTPITCAQSTGAVTVAASGGVSPYQFSLDGGALQASNSFSALAVGAHKVTVRDAAGCVADVSFTVAQVNSTLTASATVTNSTCGQANGGIAFTASGGTTPYTYSIDNGAYGASSTFTGLTAGQHNVAVKDNAGCVFRLTVNVGQTSALPNLVVSNPPRLCPGVTANLQAASVTAGSDAGLVFSYWQDTAATVSLTNANAVGAGTYYIKATNASGCSTVKPVTVTAQSFTPGTISAPRLTACLGDTVVLYSSLGQSYQWYRNDSLLAGATGIVYRATVGGIYSLVISDGACSAKATNTVTINFNDCPPDAQAYVPTGFTPNRNGANDVLRPVFYHVAQLRYFRVFNRWGQLVYETATIGRGWDGNFNGTPQPPEVYTWVLECVGKNGSVIKTSGRSLLIR